jgi:hypothetical protein
MTMNRALLMGLAAALALAGCKKDDKGRTEGPTPTPVVKDTTAVQPAPDPGASSGPGMTLPTSDVKGLAVSPVVTKSITFVVPKDAGTWAEMSFPCYAAGATMGGGGSKPSDAFNGVSPLIPLAMTAANISLDTDVAAIGGFACGEGPCIYIAAKLATPEKIKDALALVPGAKIEDHGDGHYSFGAPGAQGKRDIHVRVVPIKWSGGSLPADPWNTWQATATHVIFLSGLMGDAGVDPLTMLADAAGAAGRVKEAEAVAPDPGGRCVVGTVGPNDFKPGFKLDKARFVMAAPSGKPDPMTKLLESDRTFDVEIELTLTPAPKDSDLKKWIEEGKAWMAEVAAPIKMQFAGQGPAVDAMIDMFSLIGERGFKPTITGNNLQLSWRTDRLPQSDLDAIETKLQAVMGTP